MLDYYNLPADFPQFSERPKGTCFDRVQFLEQAFKEDINHPRFMPYLELHEFEAMLFAEPQKIDEVFSERTGLPDLCRIRRAVNSPEEINEKNPPSKCISSLYPAYQKAFHGPLVAAEIGLEQIRDQCTHFAAWLEVLESVGT